MSIKFHWDKLGTQHEEQARQFLNDFFHNIKKPDFIGDIVVTTLTFGDEPPYITLVDFCEPEPLPRPHGIQTVPTSPISSAFTAPPPSTPLPKQAKEVPATTKKKPPSTQLEKAKPEPAKRETRHRRSPSLPSTLNLLPSLPGHTRAYARPFYLSSTAYLLGHNNLRQPIHPAPSRSLPVINSWQPLGSTPGRDSISFPSRSLPEGSIPREQPPSPYAPFISESQDNISTARDKNDPHIKFFSDDDHVRSRMKTPKREKRADKAKSRGGDGKRGKGRKEEREEKKSELEELAAELLEDLSLQVKVRLKYSGTAQMTIKTEFVVNIPHPRTVCLPIEFTISDFVFKGLVHAVTQGGKVVVYFDRDTKYKEEGPLKNFKLALKVGDQTRGHLAAMQKVETFVVEKLKELLMDTLVSPNYLTVMDIHNKDGKGGGGGSIISGLF